MIIKQHIVELAMSEANVETRAVILASEKVVEAKNYIVHAVFYCRLCEEYIDRDDIELSAHARSTAVIFSHNDNHLLELREMKQTNNNTTKGNV